MQKMFIPAVLAYRPIMYQERTKDVNWETCFWTFWIDNKLVPTFIFIIQMWLAQWWRNKIRILTFTHWKNFLQSSYPGNCDCSDLDQPLHMAQKIFPYATLTDCNHLLWKVTSLIFIVLKSSFYFNLKKILFFFNWKTVQRRSPSWSKICNHGTSHSP